MGLVDLVDLVDLLGLGDVDEFSIGSCATPNLKTLKHAQSKLKPTETQLKSTKHN